MSMHYGPTNVTDENAQSKVLIWGREAIEANTIEQAQKTARLPFVFDHLALMPDAHVGIGATVGSVIATEKAIVPAAVGVDIGCGMVSVQTNLSASDLPDDLGALHSAIAGAVPAGLGRGHEKSLPPFVEALAQFRCENTPPALVRNSQELSSRVVKQFGSLGSGNHFVEVCLDEDDAVWIVLHSGSRGVGNKVAQHHIEGAKGLMRQYFIELEDPDLAYFAEGTPEFAEYIRDMLWAQEYARTNREQMMSAVLELMFAATQHPTPEVVRSVNCHHNYTEREHHMGRDLWVTRKGAIRARVDDWGIIPGSMATGTYIVTGLGNVPSFTSASHGAGRRMSRGVARKTVTEDELRESMAGKVWNDTEAKALLDESPAAYKPIEDVMAAQADLVKVEFVLRQILNYKGTS